MKETTENKNSFLMEKWELGTIGGWIKINPIKPI